ncbi:serine hydrolase domain-containing protein [Nonomuraea sp. NPDC049486]|uniref:serine hydrolase domain-containing protein n=1 Tax=Nonomuraea sp. NPDC049486 TaxID=3155773 RepID=UPI003416CFF8
MNAGIQRVLDRAVAGGGVPGIVADVRDADRSWFGTAGVADLTTRRARRPGEHFRIGSLTKAFTAVVVLRLVAEGGLTLDDTVATWLPGLAEEQLGADGTTISVRRLLNHTSGLPDVIPGLETPPLEEPGGFRYSKVNYNLAGMIVERVTGSTLAEEIARHVTRPLGLTGTYLPGDDQTLREPHARHYAKQPDAEIHDVTATDLSWAWAAGGMVSTTADLHAFLHALLRGRLLPPGLRREMFTTVSTEGTGWVPHARYGLGVYSQRLSCGVTVWGGGGAVPGSWSYAMADRDGSRAVVANANGDWGDLMATFGDLLDARFRMAGTGP